MAISRQILSVLGCLAMVLAGGCTTETTFTPAEEFRIQIPAPPALTLDEINELKRSLCAPDGEPPAHTLTASSFDEHSANPRLDDSGWQAFIAIYSEVRDDAIRCGWTIEIDGFTQSSAPVGTSGSDLSQRRADSTRLALLALGYPSEGVAATGRGVGGPDAEDRRVDIKFVRS